ncbi:MAG: adenosylcobinamide-GDP ribazoletransferase [Huintestinicola sp.]
MSVIKSFLSALSMYSRIPVPTVEWEEENHRYSLCFFPVIGAVIGALFLLWSYLCSAASLANGLVFGAISAVIPLAVTGGIHMDGYCDVCDAKASFAPREKALEIMSDPHIGAFAAINLGVYLILQTAFFSLAYGYASNEGFLVTTAMTFVLSRALSGLAAVTFRCAKKDGTLQSFSRPADKKTAVCFLTAEAIAASFFMIYFSPVSGAAGVLAALIIFAYYRIFSYKRFGGITGDLAGYFLELSELGMLIAVSSSQHIFTVGFVK